MCFLFGTGFIFFASETSETSEAWSRANGSVIDAVLGMLAGCDGEALRNH